MYKKILSVISTVTVSCAMFFTSNVVKAAVLQDRLSGNDRYQTNSKIVDSGWTTSNYAVIASGEGFADALCAAPLAKKYNAPILLTGRDNLDSNTENELKSLNVKNVFIVGGPGVVSDNIKNELNSKGIQTTRIYGQNRFETSLQVAKSLGDASGVVVTNGFGFADALSIAPVAAQKGMPILLTDKDDLPASVKEFLANSSYSKSYTVGGNGVVSDKIASQLKGNTRVGGDSRYGTNAAVLNQFANEFNYEKVYVASGQNYPDALSGSVLAASNSSPLILVGTSIDSSVMSSVKTQHDKYKKVIVLGGTGVVSDTLANDIVSGVITTPVEMYSNDISNKEVIAHDKAKEIINKVIKPGMSDLQKELALHDYIILNTKYDTDNFVKGTIPQDSYSAYGALVNGVAVCEGYAEAMSLLLNEVGIETKVVVGEVNLGGCWQLHAWNMVKIGGVYYQLDVTWDNADFYTDGFSVYKYFNLTDTQMSKDHKWNANNYPKNDAYKDNDTTIVTFKDKNLDQVVREAINKPTGDIYKSDIENIMTLDAQCKKIQDISELKNLVNLVTLDLYYNQISDISALKGLTNLYYLNLGGNQISDITAVKNLSNLQSLKLGINQISDITAVSGLTNLQYLDLSWNQISDISAVSGLTGLKDLSFYHNQISNISAIRGLASLQRLTSGCNQISDVTAVSGLTNLQYLELSSSQISDISALKNLTNLQSLVLCQNQISNIDAIKGLTNLKDVNLCFNQISDISAVENLTNLQSLMLNNNQISDISSLKNLSNLQGIILHNNQISDISALKGLVNLQCITLYNNQISDADKQSLKNALPNCKIQYQK